MGGINGALASIQRIEKIDPIDGADNIEIAHILGWQVVTQKSNNFKVGDLVVYFSIDSVLPERKEFEFLRDRCYVSAERSVNGAGFRLRTIKLKGQVSQGLILPISALADPSENHPGGWDFIKLGKTEYFEDHVQIPVEIHTFLPEEGDDLTEHLGVVKYEKPLPAQLAGMARGNFPSFLRKTDQERIQNCFKYLKRDWNDHAWEVTMKLDGSSFTAYYRKHPDLVEGQFGVCSRNLDLQETEGNAFWQVARKYKLEEKLKELDCSIAIQGEMYGMGIQNNHEGINTVNLAVFDIYDIDNNTYVDSEKRLQIVELLGLEHVPVIEKNMSLSNVVDVNEILEMAKGPSLHHKIREGIVFKSLTDPNTSFKAINNDWLLKYD